MADTVLKPLSPTPNLYQYLSILSISYLISPVFPFALSISHPISSSPHTSLTPFLSHALSLLLHSSSLTPILLSHFFISKLLEDPSNFFVVDLATTMSESAGVPQIVQVGALIITLLCFIPSSLLLYLRCCSFLFCSPVLFLTRLPSFHFSSDLPSPVLL